MLHSINYVTEEVAINKVNVGSVIDNYFNYKVLAHLI